MHYNKFLTILIHIPLALSFFALQKSIEGCQKYNKYFLFLLLIFSISFGKFDPKLMHFSASDIDSTTKKITVTFIVPEKDFIYKDFIHCSVHEPHVTLSPWKEDKQSLDYYDPLFNETKKVFNETFSLSMTATTDKWISDPVHLYCSYYRKSEKKMNHQLFTFSFAPPTVTHLPQEEIEDTSTINPHIFTHSFSLFEVYATKFHTIMHQALNHFNYYSSFYFYFLIFLIFLFYIVSHFYKQKLQKYPNLQETLIFTQLFLSVIAIGYAHLYLISSNFVQANFTFGWLSTLSFGYLYIKKSTQTHLVSLSTFCTFFGVILIAGSFILLFKAVQFYY